MKKTKRKSASPRKSNSVDVFIGKRMRELRHVNNISQVELGQELGVSFQQIQKYEKGANRVSTGRLVQICQALECSITDLAEGLSGKDAKITAASQFAAS